MIVHWTARATRHLEEIHAYVAAGSPGNADALVERILQRSETLGRFPMLGAVVPSFARKGYREVLEPPYRIIYRVHGEQVQILAVVHGARRLPRSLDKL